jgi:hypothetical protein
LSIEIILMIIFLEEKVKNRRQIEHCHGALDLEPERMTLSSHPNLGG